MIRRPPSSTLFPYTPLSGSAPRRAAIDRGDGFVLGVNKYQTAEPAAFELRDIDDRAVRDRQIARLAALRARRDPKAVAAALDGLRRAAGDDGAHLLEMTLPAMPARATGGEVSDPQAAVFTQS